MQADPTALLIEAGRPSAIATAPGGIKVVAPAAGIDLARHVLALAVIVQHMHSISRYSPQVNAVLDDVCHYVDGAVAGFFLISGFLFKMPVAARSYIGRRAVRLLVPFLLFSAIYAGVLGLLGKSGAGSAAWAILSMHGVGPQLYFLPDLLLVSIAYLAARLALGRRVNPLWLDLCLLVSMVILSQLWKTSATTGPDPGLLSLYFSAFLAGRVLSEVGQLRAGAAALAGCVSLGVMGDGRYYSLALVLLWVVSCMQLSRYLPDRRLSGSGGIYLLHTPVINFAISTLLYRVGVAEGPNLIASIVATYGLCLMLTLGLLRSAPRWGWLLLE